MPRRKTRRQNFPNRVAQRRADAEARALTRKTRGDRGQLERLERDGHGDCREARRLTELARKTRT